MQAARKIEQEFAATWDDPVAFSHGVFTDPLWSRQDDILRAIGHPHASVAVKGCHASSKTHCAARAALWFASRYDDGIVVTTAPKEDQLELLLWKEIHAALRQSRVQYPTPLTTMLRLNEAGDNYIVGLVAKDAVRFQGFHAPHLLFILEEAPGVIPAIWEAIEGARAGGDVRIVALGNPTIVGGPFYDAFTKARSRWTTVSINAFDTPNFAALKRDAHEPWSVTLQALLALDEDALHENPCSYLATRTWVREKWFEWGQHDHPLWYARVLGEFPPQSEDALISLAWIEAAKQRTPVVSPDMLIDVGIDVAGPGESETVAVARQGARILRWQAWNLADPLGVLMQFLQPYRDRLRRVNVDCVGIGYHIAMQLQRERYPVVFVNVGEKPHEPERYKNLKAEYYWGLRLRFEAGDIGGDISDEPIGPATSQLASIRYKTNERGQTLIESKEDAIKRGVKSPDHAEAIMLAFAESGGGAPLAANLAPEPHVGIDWSEAP